MYAEKHPYKDMKQVDYAEEINHQEFTQNVRRAKAPKNHHNSLSRDISKDGDSDSAVEQSDHYLPDLKLPPRVENDYSLVKANNSSSQKANNEYGKVNSNSDNKHSANTEGGRNEKIRAGHSFNYQTASDKQLIFSNR